MTKTSLFVILALVVAVFPAGAEDWTTTDGKTYKNVTVISHDTKIVTINSSDGAATFPIKLLGDDLQKRVNGDNVTAKDWLTTDGKSYKNVTVIKHDDITVTILDEDGGASVPLEKLPTDLQKKFGYDPAKAQAEIDAANKAEADEKAALEQSAALKKKVEAVTKSAATLIGTIVDSRSDGYFVAVYPEDLAPRSPSYAGSHNGLGPVAVTDPGWQPPGNAVSVGTYFLKTKNTFQQGQHLGLTVYPCGTVPNPPQRPITAFTDDLDTASGGASSKLPQVQPLPQNNPVPAAPPKANQFNPGSINDNPLK